MAGKTLRSITTNGDYYQKAFRLFCEKCGKAKVDREWTRNVFPSAVVDKLRPLPKGQSLRSLGIGSGTGDFECAQLQELSKRFDRIRHTVVEPAHAFIHQYQTSVEQDKNSFTGVEFEWREETMQKFTESFRLANKKTSLHHLISSVHSIYYADSLPETLRGFHDRLLENGGILMVAVTTGESSNSKFARRFPDLFGQGTGTSVFDGTAVREALDSLKFPYAVHNQPSAADISVVFDASSSEGGNLLDFLTHTIDFRGTAPKPLLDEVLAFLRSEECCRLDDGGAVLFENPWDTFVIQKSL
ncbi:histamine N-methyltransferase-like [Diadema antillarum]|uniref:histamine N-methyltransferase-like n=1 Tax=Diadema antillarum TaxID=105358 RepID=UPI003A86FBCF